MTNGNDPKKNNGANLLAETTDPNTSLTASAKLFYGCISFPDSQTPA